MHAHFNVQPIHQGGSLSNMTVTHYYYHAGDFEHEEYSSASTDDLFDLHGGICIER